MTDLQKELFSMQDEAYKSFNSKLLPTVNPDSVIGIRIPVLRKFAKDFSKKPEALEFLKILPHRYFDENNLHAFLIESIKDYDIALSETKRFLPYIDNWATCDMFLPKVFKKNPEKLLSEIKQWIKSDLTYTVRYAIGLLMSIYLDEHFSPDYLALVSEVHSDEYYINMMIAWYFATALAKQYETAITYITDYKLDPWVHNKTIQKAIESSRISNETKEYLKSFKIHS